MVWPLKPRAFAAFYYAFLSILFSLAYDYTLTLFSQVALLPGLWAAAADNIRH
jgi:hypothetical protein